MSTVRALICAVVLALFPLLSGCGGGQQEDTNVGEPASEREARLKRLGKSLPPEQRPKLDASPGKTTP